MTQDSTQLEERSIAARAVQVVRGSLSVPEAAEDPLGPTIELHWARLTSWATTPQTPLLYLAEGPGVPVLRDLDRPERLERWARFLETRDVILFDQRGCGASGRDLRWRATGDPPTEFFEDSTVAMERVLAMSREGRRELEGHGAALASYNARQFARDVLALLDCWDLSEVVLAGFSWGAQLGIEVMRQAPDRIQQAVLAGVEGPADALKLPLQTDHYFSLIARRAKLENDLAERLERAASCLDRDPLRVEVLHRGTGSRFTLRVGAFGLRMLLCRELYAPQTLHVLPQLLDEILAGTATTLSEWARRHVGLALRVDGMPWLVDGASGATPSRLQEIRQQAARSRFGNVMNFPLPEAGEVWGAIDLGDAYREDIGCEVPTLLVSGELDWNAPPKQAARVADAFSKSHHVVVPNAVHQQLFSDPRIMQMIGDVLDGVTERPRARVDAPAWMRESCQANECGDD